MISASKLNRYKRRPALLKRSKPLAHAPREPVQQHRRRCPVTDDVGWTGEVLRHGRYPQPFLIQLERSWADLVRLIDLRCWHPYKW